MDKRKEKLYADLDALGEELVTTPMMVRLTVLDDLDWNCKYLLEAGFKFDPRILRFNELPPFLAERLAILKMLNKFQEIPDIGKRFSDNVYHVPISVRVWESIAPTALPNPTTSIRIL